MPNRYHTPFSKQRIHGSTPPKDPKGTGPAPYKEKSFSWPGAPGPKGPRLNKVGLKEVKAYAVQDLADDASLRVSKKISKLRHEGEPPEKSVAMALNMERKGRLTESGGYKRKRG